MTLAQHRAHVIQHDMIHRFARRRRVIELQRLAQEAAQVERAGQVRKLDQFVEGIHVSGRADGVVRHGTESTGAPPSARYFATSPSSVLSAASLGESATAFLRVSVSDTFDISVRSQATSVGWSGCGNES